MDLALELGWTEEQVRSRMSERELTRWAQYARQRRGLPSRRIEVYLANLARLVAASAGVSEPLAHWLILDPPESEPEPPKVEDAAAAIASAVVGGAAIYKLGRVKIADVLKQQEARSA